mgnify:CR=1 FL=1
MNNTVQNTIEQYPFQGGHRADGVSEDVPDGRFVHITIAFKGSAVDHVGNNVTTYSRSQAATSPNDGSGTGSNNHFDQPQNLEACPLNIYVNGLHDMMELNTEGIYTSEDSTYNPRNWNYETVYWGESFIGSVKVDWDDGRGARDPDSGYQKYIGIAPYREAKKIVIGNPIINKPLTHKIGFDTTTRKFYHTVSGDNTKIYSSPHIHPNTYLGPGAGNGSAGNTPDALDHDSLADICRSQISNLMIWKECLDQEDHH